MSQTISSDINFESKAFDSVTENGFTVEQLRTAFELVENKDHWKGPIDSYVTSDEVKAVATAIRFFTATEGKFDVIGFQGADVPNSRFRVGDFILKVRADGYWAGPAA